MTQKLTPQSAFDKILFGIRERGYTRAVALGIGGEMTRCVYRGVDAATGNPISCAFGLLIPDDIYKLAWDEEALGAGELIGRVAEVRDLFDHAAFAEWAEALNNQTFGMYDEHAVRFFSRRLQMLHDDILEDGGAAWERRMEKFAKQFQLRYTPK